MSVTPPRDHLVKEAPVPWSAILNRQYAPLVTLVSLGVWLHAADTLLVSTMMPAIVSDIGGAGLVSWTITLYEIGTIAIGASSGLLAIRYGLAYPMSIAATGFALGCAISALSMTMPMMLVGRLLQGAGGGGLMALSFVAVGILFEKRLIARVIAVISMLWGASAFLGPMIGAFFVEYASWRAGFWAFSLQALILALWITFGHSIRGITGRSEDAQSQAGLPALRLIILCASILFIAAAGINVSATKTLVCLVLGVFSLVLFVYLDQLKEADRLLPKMQGTAIHDSSVLVAGYVVACPAIAWTCFAVAVSGSPPKNDARLISIGMLLVTTGVAGLVWSVPNGPIWLIACFGFLQGGGFGMAWTFMLRRITALCPANDHERVASALPTVQTLGYALGAAYVGILANAAGFSENGTASEIADVAYWTFLGCVPLTLIGLAALRVFVKARV